MADDKKLHFLCGYAITITIALFNIYYGLGAGILAGVLKECYDKYDYGLFDKQDMLATWAGVLLAFGIAYATK